MKYALLSCVAVAALCTSSAIAADLPVKAPPIVCPGCNWNGWYVGVNLGGSIGHDRSNDSIALNPAGTFGALAPGVANPISGTSYSSSPAGFLGGGQVGFNWQMGHLVLGAEADWDAASQRDTVQIDNFLASSVVVAPATYGYTDQEKIKWLATARARLGWAQGYTMSYVTAGPAWGGVDSNYTFQAAQSVGTTFISAPGAANFSSTRIGWAIGSGIETSLGWMGANHWSAKMEYLYVDLGSVSHAFSVANTGGAAPGSAYTIASTSHIHDNIVRVGLNYRFGGENFGPPPAMTPGPCPTCNWTGVYVGFNESTSIGHDRTHETASLLPSTANGADVTNPVTDVLHTESPVGWGAGGQVGANWQTGSLVLGAEADWDWMNERDTFSNVNFIASTAVVAPAQVAITDEQKLKSLATARARIGWADNCFLWYVTGGVAWGRVESNYGFQGVALNGAAIFGSPLFGASVSQTKTGWTVGGGVETTMNWLGLSNRWSSKFEYLYVDLGSITNSFVVPVTGSPGVYSYTSTSEIRDHIVRFGVNYRFGG
jgi:outer membrane immunogenic protein